MSNEIKLIAITRTQLQAPLYNKNYQPPLPVLSNKRPRTDPDVKLAR